MALRSIGLRCVQELSSLYHRQRAGSACCEMGCKELPHPLVFFAKSAESSEKNNMLRTRQLDPFLGPAVAAGAMP